MVTATKGGGTGTRKGAKGSMTPEQIETCMKKAKRLLAGVGVSVTFCTAAWTALEESLGKRFGRPVTPGAAAKSYLTILAGRLSGDGTG
jgi:hypothetical protein